MTSDQPDYRSYLLRLWQVKEDDRHSWRASLEDTRTGELMGFADLDALVDYLKMFEETEQLNQLNSR